MTGVRDIDVSTYSLTGYVPKAIVPGDIEAFLQEEERRTCKPSIQKYHSTSTMSLIGTTVSSASAEGSAYAVPFAERAPIRWTVDWDAINQRPAIAATRGTGSTSVTVGSLKKLFRMHQRDEWLSRMSPGHRLLYDRIKNLREKIGPIGFEVVDFIREFRDRG